MMSGRGESARALDGGLASEAGERDLEGAGDGVVSGVFSVVNVALLVLRRRPGEPRGGFEVPRFVPALGALVCSALLVNRVLAGDWRAPALAGALLGLILLAFAVFRPKVTPEAMDA